VSGNHPCTEAGYRWGAVPQRDETGEIIRDGNGKVVTEDADIDVVAVIRRGNERIDIFGECGSGARPWGWAYWKC